MVSVLYACGWLALIFSGFAVSQAEDIGLVPAAAALMCGMLLLALGRLIHLIGQIAGGLGVPVDQPHALVDTIRPSQLLERVLSARKAVGEMQTFAPVAMSPECRRCRSELRQIGPNSLICTACGEPHVA